MESLSSLEPRVALFFFMMAFMGVVAVTSAIGLLVFWRKKNTYGIKPVLAVMLAASSAIVFLVWNYSDPGLSAEVQRIVGTLI